MSAAVAVAAIVLSRVFAGAIVLGGALALWKFCIIVFSTGPCKEWKTGRTSKLLTERIMSFASPQVASCFGAAETVLGDWKFFQAAAAFRRAITTGFVFGSKGTFNVGPVKGPFSRMSFSARWCSVLWNGLQILTWMFWDFGSCWQWFCWPLPGRLWWTFLPRERVPLSVPDSVDCEDGSVALVGFSSAPGTVDVNDGECKVGVHEVRSPCTSFR